MQRKNYIAGERLHREKITYQEKERRLKVYLQKSSDVQLSERTPTTGGGEEADDCNDGERTRFLSGSGGRFWCAEMRKKKSGDMKERARPRRGRAARSFFVFRCGLISYFLRGIFLDSEVFIKRVPNDSHLIF